MARKRQTGSAIQVHGFFRLKIGIGKGKRAKVIGDTGWLGNMVTETGRNRYIAAAVGSITASWIHALYLQLATQTQTVASNQTSLSGETKIRKAGDRSVINYGTLQLTASWSSSDQTETAGVTIGSIAIYGTDTGGSLAAGQTFTTSLWASNQNVSATYQLRFQ